MKYLLLVSLFITSSAMAFTGIEIANPQVRVEENDSGTPRSFINNPRLAWKLFYQHNSKTRFTWGASYYSQGLDFSSGNDGLNFDDDSWIRTRITAYAAIGSRQGFFGQVGVHHTKTPYFFDDDGIISGKLVSRNDLFVKAGVYYKTGFGGGELTLKYVSIPSASIDGSRLSGSGTEFYFSMYLNKAQNFGLFFNYVNEFVNGDHEVVYDSRSIGIVARI